MVSAFEQLTIVESADFNAEGTVLFSRIHDLAGDAIVGLLAEHVVFAFVSDYHHGLF